MELAVYSRGAIEAVSVIEAPHVIVSITTTRDDRAALPAGPSCAGVLRLVFADVDDVGGAHIAFDAEHARAVWDFVEQHRERVSRIVLHCDAGISRSPAVAAAIARALGHDDAPFFRRYRPNMRVYRTLLEVWHERGRELG